MANFEEHHKFHQQILGKLRCIFCECNSILLKALFGIRAELPPTLKIGLLVRIETFWRKDSKSGKKFGPFLLVLLYLMILVILRVIKHGLSEKCPKIVQKKSLLLKKKY